MKDLIKRVFAVICAVGIMSAYTGVTASEITPRPMPGTSGAVTREDTESKDVEDSSSYGVSAIDETRTRSSSAASSANSAGASNYIASSETGNGEDAENTGEGNTGEQDNSVQAPTIIPANAYNNESVPQSQEEAPKKERGSVGMGALFLWFLLSVIVNAVISFWMGNRFYKMARKDTHVTAEVRALRRDIEEKFVSNVGDFSEMENEISNSNEDYSGDDYGIKIPERKAKETAVVTDGFEEDAFRRWENRQTEVQNMREQNSKPEKNVEQTQRINMSRARRRAAEEPPKKKQYQPKRAEINEFSDEDETGETVQKKSNQSLNTVKNRAKEFLGDIFPFKDEE